MGSSVEIHGLKAGQSRVVFQSDALIEAPNRAPDGHAFAFVRYSKNA
ncbi:hypothetical protein [Martelella mediterranea]|uniref:Uncharacterized protein n=1 Tax=Martelella mediterranea TaxID=293089 RepID=A0A4R3NTL5_9HYPH|nr:hypothetical protein [Martelella mediterranea]TCT40866.1 hypothetical protein EDC90_10086 [Martelella mediterranea]